MNTCPPSFSWALLEAGDIPDGEAATLATHRATCETCMRISQTLSDRVEAFQDGRERHWQGLSARLAVEQSASHQRRPREHSRHWLGARSRWLMAFATMALSGSAALFLVVIRQPNAPHSASEATKKPPALVEGAPNHALVAYKGALSWQVIAKRHGEQFFVEPEAILRENDALRFVVTTDRSGYLSLFSIDAQGTTSSLYPESDPSLHPEPWRIEEAGRHELPGSALLDDAVGSEIFILFFSEERFLRPKIHRTIGAAFVASKRETSAGKIRFNSKNVDLNALGRHGQMRTMTINKVARKQILIDRNR